ncbi:MAG: hypothetical protein DRI57_13120 [Deltaproteobacteria bacterium]|nr:MAG: hypothetical protein DRI57_13120 [Deltaproteobacteria bacterium]
MKFQHIFPEGRRLLHSPVARFGLANTNHIFAGFGNPAGADFGSHQIIDMKFHIPKNILFFIDRKAYKIRSVLY